MLGLSGSRQTGINPRMAALRAKLSETSEPDLARLAMSGSEVQAQSALDEICRRFAPRVRLYGWKHLRDSFNVEELVQRVLLVVVRSLKERSVLEPEAFASYVLGVARVQSLELVRKSRREPPASDEQMTELWVDPQSEPEPQALKRLSDCLERLPERERSVIVLSYLQEENSPIIAKNWGTTVQNIRVIRHRAIGRLRDCMGHTEVLS